MALVKIAGGVVDSGVQFPEADLREMRAVTASCSCTAGLDETREDNGELKLRNSTRIKMHASVSVIRKPTSRCYVHAEQRNPIRVFFY
jgi:hypothetical protein